MRTIASDRRTVFGMTCEQCGNLLFAPEWSEPEDDRHILDLWHCSICGCHFETEALVAATDIPAKDDVVIKEFFPSLLVA